MRITIDSANEMISFDENEYIGGLMIEFVDDTDIEMIEFQTLQDVKNLHKLIGDAIEHMEGRLRHGS